MLLLFEAALGFALFHVHDEGKLEQVDVRRESCSHRVGRAAARWLVAAWAARATAPFLEE